MIFSIIYDFIFAFFTLLSLPRLLYLYYVKKKYNNSLKQRFGLEFPVVDKKGKPLIWIHAVSVGETRAVISLAKMLKDNYTLLISSITETGHAEAKRSLPFADYHVFLPVDLKFIVNPIVREVKPDFCIISETDLWFQFLRSVKKNGAKTVLVNGKISEKSFQRLKFLAFFCNRLYSLIDFFSVQNELYKTRFCLLGVDENKIAVTGNLKFDEDYKRLNDQEIEAWKDKLGIKPGIDVLVVGSTHYPEEIIVLDALKKITSQYPDLKVILVPRHPERFNAVEKELERRGLDYCRFSKVDVCEAKFVLIDAMGLLRQCYQVAILAIVGGSFTKKIGGHNILEPLGYGVPVIFGPYMYSQPDLLQLVIDYQAGVQINEENLSSEIDSFLGDSEKRCTISANGLKLISDVKGSTKKAFEVCEKVFY